VPIGRNNAGNARKNAKMAGKILSFVLSIQLDIEYKREVVIPTSIGDKRVSTNINHPLKWVVFIL
jgi:hypothetical protein